ncbi:hypothetical protein H5410_031859 [Solanum commersonii]|uniref:Uncharacterized protein n=1 Tax=Solanum commersonii TaxID=4109 RepID=A0A9J5YJH3_SOLCO|nr:hypothetical protein H5410_031859 [Solanum commersonii]
MKTNKVTPRVQMRRGRRRPFKKHSTIGESYNTNCIALQRNNQRSSFRRSTCNDEVLFEVPRDQIHLKEVYIILHSRNTLLKALESRRSVGEKKTLEEASTIGETTTSIT